MYKVIMSDSFSKDLEKVNNSVQVFIPGILEQLMIKPHVSRQLRYPFFREKKVKRNYHLYYLIY